MGLSWSERGSSVGQFVDRQTKLPHSNAEHMELPKTRKPKMAAPNLPPHLPDDLIFLILIRLPAKSVLRFRSVSESWNTLITSPRFTRRHHSLALRRNPATFLAAFPFETVGSFFSKGNTLVWITVDRLQNSVRVFREAYDRASIRKITDAPQIVGDACAGVFCVSYGMGAALWNPATRELRVVKFGFGGVADLDLTRALYIGFGSLEDELSNVVNFKLLLLARNCQEGGPIGHFLLYSLRTNSWSLIKYPCFPIGSILHSGYVCLNGVIHWLAEGGVLANTAYILTFDMVQETFGRIELPHTDGIEIIDRNSSNFLTAIDNQYLSFVMVDRVAKCLTLWTMGDKGGQRAWVKLKQVEPLMKTGFVVRYFDCIGGAVTQGDFDGKIWYHVKGYTSEHETGLYGFTTWFQYSESLVSLKRIANQQDNLEGNE